jgi:predicted phosphodiesterase
VLEAERVDRILCTGDLVDGEGDVVRACRLLREAGALVVRGNHDRWIAKGDLRTLPHAHVLADLDDETAAMLRALPPSISLDVPGGGRLLLCHGVAENDMQRLRSDTFGYDLQMNDELAALRADASIAFMVGGHTHEPMVRTFARDGERPLVVVNAGTLARRDGSGFVILDVERRVARFFAIDESLAVTSVRETAF